MASEQPLALARGENLAGMDGFDAFTASPALSVLQPDLGKWGGITGCLAVGRLALERRKLFCPHWLGGGIDLTASFT